MMPARTKDRMIAGPESPIASPMTTKMPVPMMAPRPSAVRSSRPTTRCSDAPFSSVSRTSASVSLVAKRPLRPSLPRGGGHRALLSYDGVSDEDGAARALDQLDRHAAEHLAGHAALGARRRRRSRRPPSPRRRAGCRATPCRGGPRPRPRRRPRAAARAKPSTAFCAALAELGARGGESASMSRPSSETTETAAPVCWASSAAASASHGWSAPAFAATTMRCMWPAAVRCCARAKPQRGPSGAFHTVGRLCRPSSSTASTRPTADQPAAIDGDRRERRRGRRAARRCWAPPAPARR